MANCVLVQTRACASDVSALNRKGIATEPIQNGQPLVCGELEGKDGEKEDVFKVTKASAKAKGLWLAYAPETTRLVQGENIWRGMGSLDPREFINPAGIVFDIFKPVAGVDVIQVSKEFFAEGFDPKTVSRATHVEIQSNGEMKAVTSSTITDGLQFRILDKHDFIIANGDIGGDRVDGWYLECTIN